MIMEIEERDVEELKRKIQELKRENEKLSEELHLVEQEKEHLSFRIETELEPRIKQEKRAYDAYVSTDHAAEAAESFCGKVDELIKMVQDNDNYFEWDYSDGDLYERVLFLIKSQINY